MHMLTLPSAINLSASSHASDWSCVLDWGYVTRALPLGDVPTLLHHLLVRNDAIGIALREARQPFVDGPLGIPLDAARQRLKPHHLHSAPSDLKYCQSNSKAHAQQLQNLISVLAPCQINGRPDLQDNICNAQQANRWVLRESNDDTAIKGFSVCT